MSVDAVVARVMERLYAARGVVDFSEFDAGLERLLPPKMRGLPEAAALLAGAIEAGEPVLVIGDYDADGATGTALAVRGLRRLGAQDVDFLIPDRATEGYGLTPAIVARACARKPRWIMTVDNGINSLDGAHAAAAAGVGLIITDHHLPGPVLPAACAIVNPNQAGCPFGSKALAGVGVVLYLLIALRQRLGVEAPLADLLDLVALGTVADCVPLDANNRLLVRHGLRRINRGAANPGIAALIRVGGRHAGAVVAQDLGFQVGPRLNAAGRLADMETGVRLLLTEDAAEAERLAGELDALNRERRAREKQMQGQAQTALRAVAADELPAGLCVMDGDWHPGVIGILASRLKDAYQRPVLALAPGDEGLLRGSGRSVGALNLRDTLAAIAERHPRLFLKFGGHAAAAGFTIAEGDYPELARVFAEEVQRRCGPPPYPDRRVDGPLEACELTMALAQAVRAGGPWGNGFAEPLFTGEFRVLEGAPVRGGHWRLRLAADGVRGSLKAIAFRCDAGPADGRICADYRLGVDEYGGRAELCLFVEAWAAVGAPRGCGVQCADEDTS